MTLSQYRLAGGLAGAVIGGALVLALTSCDSQASTFAQHSEFAAKHPFSSVTVQHDDTRAVTCWVYSSPTVSAGGVSCLPDWMLTKPTTALAIEQPQ